MSTRASNQRLRACSALFIATESLIFPSLSSHRCFKLSLSLFRDLHNAIISFHSLDDQIYLLVRPHDTPDPYFNHLEPQCILIPNDDRKFFPAEWTPLYAGVPVLLTDASGAKHGGGWVEPIGLNARLIPPPPPGLGNSGTDSGDVGTDSVR